MSGGGLSGGSGSVEGGFVFGDGCCAGGVAPHFAYWPGFILRQQVTVLSVWLHSPSMSTASAPAHPKVHAMAMTIAREDPDELA